MKVLTVMQFDFDYDFDTPFVFIQMFLETNFEYYKSHLSFRGIDHNKLKAFGEAYDFFDKNIKSMITKNLYLQASVSELVLFYPAPIIAGAFILLGNIKAMKNQ